LWNLLESRPIDIFSAGFFGNLWSHDIVNELKIAGARVFTAAPGENPDFNQYDRSHDCVFVLSETTTGSNVSDVRWLEHREGLSICDVTSAVFCTNIQWALLDAVAFPFQKGVGGEAGIGAVVMNERCLARVRHPATSHPLPRLLRLPRKAEDGTVDMDFFNGYTPNTVSLLGIEDILSALTWSEKIGGREQLIKRTRANYEIVARWVARTESVRFLVQDESIRSKNVACLQVLTRNGAWDNREDLADWAKLQNIADFLRENTVAEDILNHKKSVPALRIWLGPTIEPDDIQKLLPWIERGIELFCPVSQ
jgi:phosphoserine aminotransferase